LVWKEVAMDWFRNNAREAERGFERLMARLRTEKEMGFAEAARQREAHHLRQVFEKKKPPATRRRQP
jgi:hypothetical protein